MTTTPAPAFLRLPAELRNKIYHLALTGSDIPGWPHGMAEPAMLSVCKQVRKEAGPIFWAGNQFELMIDDYSSAAACFYTAKMSAIDTEFGGDGVRRFDPRFTWMGSSTPNWHNLITFMRHFYEKRAILAPGFTDSVTRALPFDPPTQSSRILQAMFSIVGAMRDKPGTEAETLLLPFRNILEEVRSGWID